MNLLANSIKFTSSGSVAVHVSTLDIAVLDDCVTSGSRICVGHPPNDLKKYRLRKPCLSAAKDCVLYVKIQDTGSGIPREKIGQAFGQFMQMYGPPQQSLIHSDSETARLDLMDHGAGLGMSKLLLLPCCLLFVHFLSRFVHRKTNRGIFSSEIVDLEFLWREPWHYSAFHFSNAKEEM